MCFAVPQYICLSTINFVFLKDVDLEGLPLMEFLHSLSEIGLEKSKTESSSKCLSDSDRLHLSLCFLQVFCKMKQDL